MAISELRVKYQDYYDSYCHTKKNFTDFQSSSTKPVKKWALWKSSEKAYREFKRSVRERLTTSPNEKEALQKIFSNTKILRHRQKRSKLANEVEQFFPAYRHHVCLVFDHMLVSCQSEPRRKFLSDTKTRIEQEIDDLLQRFRTTYSLYQIATGSPDQKKEFDDFIKITIPQFLASTKSYLTTHVSSSQFVGFVRFNNW